MKARMKAIAFGALSCALFSFAAQAHGGHDDRLKVRATDTALVIDTHIAAGDLLAFDTNRDGRLTAWEFRTAQDEIKAWIASRLTLRQSSGEALIPAYFDIPVSAGDMSHAEGEIEFVRVLQRYDHAPDQVMALSVSLYRGDDKQVLLYKDGKVLRRTYAGGQINLLLD